MNTRSCSITPQNGALHVRTPYDPAFVAALKASIPAAGRMWDATSKVWIVAHNYSQPLGALLSLHYPGAQMPAIAGSVAPGVETRLLDVRYVGMTKDRGDSVRTAFGYSGGGWNVILPESELRRWFGLDSVDDGRPAPAATLYQVLSVPSAASADEIKRAWRRLARQWHPDVCREPDATVQFRRIQEAYEALSDANRRARYDAGLALAAAVPPRQAQFDRFAADGFRAPLRCGYILAEGHEQLGRFLVSKILAWEDITEGGKTLVTSWPAGATIFTEAWT